MQGKSRHHKTVSRSVYKEDVTKMISAVQKKRERELHKLTDNVTTAADMLTASEEVPTFSCCSEDNDDTASSCAKSEHTEFDVQEKVAINDGEKVVRRTQRMSKGSHISNLISECLKDAKSVSDSEQQTNKSTLEQVCSSTCSSLLALVSSKIDELQIEIKHFQQESVNLKKLQEEQTQLLAKMQAEREEFEKYKEKERKNLEAELGEKWKHLRLQKKSLETRQVQADTNLHKIIKELKEKNTELENKCKQQKKTWACESNRFKSKLELAENEKSTLKSLVSQLEEQRLQLLEKLSLSEQTVQKLKFENSRHSSENFELSSKSKSHEGILSPLPDELVPKSEHSLGRVLKPQVENSASLDLGSELNEYEIPTKKTDVEEKSLQTIWRRQSNTDLMSEELSLSSSASDFDTKLRKLENLQDQTPDSKTNIYYSTKPSLGGTELSEFESKEVVPVHQEELNHHNFMSQENLKYFNKIPQSDEVRKGSGVEVSCSEGNFPCDENSCININLKDRFEDCFSMSFGQDHIQNYLKSSENRCVLGEEKLKTQRISPKVSTDASRASKKQANEIVTKEKIGSRQVNLQKQSTLEFSQNVDFNNQSLNNAGMKLLVPMYRQIFEAISSNKSEDVHPKKSVPSSLQSLQDVSVQERHSWETSERPKYFPALKMNAKIHPAEEVKIKSFSVSEFPNNSFQIGTNKLKKGFLAQSCPIAVPGESNQSSISKENSKNHSEMISVPSLFPQNNFENKIENAQNSQSPPVRDSNKEDRNIKTASYGNQQHTTKEISHQNALEIKSERVNSSSKPTSEETLKNKDLGKTAPIVYASDHEMSKTNPQDSVKTVNHKLKDNWNQNLDTFQNGRNKLSTQNLESEDIQQVSSNLLLMEVKEQQLLLSIFSKEIDPYTQVITYKYKNGDVKEVYPDGKTIYYYFKSKTVHTVFPGGCKKIEFASGQVEIHETDGSICVTYPSGVIRRISSDGEEQQETPDGIVVTKLKDGTETVDYPNGQCEVRNEFFKSRYYPNGTVKTVFADGRQMTKYPSGRVRVKDASGNILMDSICK